MGKGEVKLVEACYLGLWIVGQRRVNRFCLVYIFIVLLVISGGAGIFSFWFCLWGWVNFIYYCVIEYFLLGSGTQFYKIRVFYFWVYVKKRELIKRKFLNLRIIFMNISWGFILRLDIG